jgi:hypothetical protein
MEQATYAQNWALLTSLWSEWCPNDHAATLFLDNLSRLNQRALADAIRSHKAEELGGYKEPKLFRLVTLAKNLTPKPPEPEHPRWKVNGPSEDEIAEWDRWAEDVLANVTDEELMEVRAFAKLENRRLLAVAVSLVRERAREVAL